MTTNLFSNFMIFRKVPKVNNNRCHLQFCRVATFLGGGRRRSLRSGK